MFTVGQKVILSDNYTIRTIDNISNKTIYFKENNEFCHESDCNSASFYDINKFETNEKNKQIEINKLNQKLANMKTLEKFREFFN